MLRFMFNMPLRLPWPGTAVIFCVALCCASCQPYSTGMVEDDRMDRVLREAGPGTLVVFDIDNTLIEPVTQFGSDQWFYHLVGIRVRRGMDPRRAAELADARFNEVQKQLTMRSVDPESPGVLAELRRHGIRHFALTARSPGSRGVTRSQLADAGFDLAAGGFPPGAAAVAGAAGRGCCYDSGVFFIGETGPSKGESLCRILEKSGTRAGRIVFVDDKEKHVRSVHESLTRLGIPHLCVRFSRADAKVAAFPEEM